MTNNSLIDECRARFETWVNRRWAVGRDKPDLFGFYLTDGRWVYESEKTSELFSAYYAGEYYIPNSLHKEKTNDVI